ncbi:MAG TPA: hypothetical protein VGZ00_01375 [Candidatus Baltobacteraceae bacterium]|jgi:hypothetical protein|nr:hypothetical protein [Candidatus Baltobacteraceae bacterium]
MTAQRRTRLFTASAFVAFAVAAAFATNGGRFIERARAMPPLPPITISKTVPADLPTGAPEASIQQAAQFAWQEFIALDWAAVPQKGQQGNREAPNLACAFGDTVSPGCTGPLVWETMRAKVEIFPGSGNPPGYPAAPPAATDPSYGYDALPQYPYSGSVPYCLNATPPSQTPWINLDETDQITLDEMYAGNAPAGPLKTNSQPQLIRFLAKGNRVEYTYIAARKWWGNIPGSGSTGTPAPTASTAAYVVANNADPPAGSKTLVSLPSGTIEMKAGWRLLSPQELASGRYHTALARYYETQVSNGDPCYNQATFGLVALHIIQKTPSAPYFVYATFEQADNIRTADGKPVEDDDGRILATQACATGQATPCPTSPTEVLYDSPKNPQIVLAPTPPAPAPGYCTKPGKRLYFLEELSQPSGGYICVNRRQNDIPPAIIAINAKAHTAIRASDATHHLTNDPFVHYKLVNVQYVPIDKTQPGPFTQNDPTTGANPASFSLANSVVETDLGLQVFSGGLLAISGFISDYPQPFFQMPPPATHKNTAYLGHGYDMGGCMGCHGSQGQHQGGDFSVITARGTVTEPEPPQPGLTAMHPAGLTKSAVHRPRSIRNRKLVSY